MPETRRRYDPDFREGAIRVVRETHKPIAHVARDLGINPGTLGTWVARDKATNGDSQKPTVADQVRVKELGARAGGRRATDGA